MKCERGIGFVGLVFLILVIGIFIAFSIYLIRLDNIIRHKFEGQRWDIPAKVFARPLEIYANAPLTQENFTEELKLLLALFLLHGIAVYYLKRGVIFARLAIICILIIISLDYWVLKSFLFRFDWREAYKFIGDAEAGVSFFSVLWQQSRWQFLAAMLAAALIIYTLIVYLLQKSQIIQHKYLMSALICLIVVMIMEPASNYHYRYTQHALSAFFKSSSKYLIPFTYNKPQGISAL